MNVINLIRKEAKTLKFTLTDSSGNIIDATSATCHLYIKNDIEDSSSIITKQDSDFNKADASNGILKVTLTSDDLDRSGVFYGVLKLEFSATNIDKDIFKIVIINNTD